MRVKDPYARREAGGGVVVVVVNVFDDLMNDVHR